MDNYNVSVEQIQGFFDRISPASDDDLGDPEEYFCAGDFGFFFAQMIEKDFANTIDERRATMFARGMLLALQKRFSEGEH